MKLKYLFLSIFILAASTFGLCATDTGNQTVDTTTPIVQTTTATTVAQAVTTTAIETALDKTGEVVTAAKDATVKAINDVAPPQVRGEFMSLVIEKVRKYSAAGEEAVSKAIDEIQEQTPIVVKEYLKWHFYENVFYIAVTIVLWIVAFAVCYRTFPKWLQSLTEGTNRYETTETDVKQFKYGSLGILSLAGVIAVSLVILFNLEWYLNAIKIHVAPRVYLLEQVSNFIRQVSGR